MKIIGSEPVTVSYAKELLEKRAKDAELEYEQLQASEHADKFYNSKSKADEKLANELIAKNEKLDMEAAMKLVDIRPKLPETVRAVLLRKKADLTDEEVDELLKMLSK